MTQDIRQWLDEIKRLKQQLAQTQLDLNAAVESSDQWRQRYNTEAQQRRQEAGRYLEQVGELRGELDRWQRLSPLPHELQVRVAVRQEIDQLKTLDEVKAKLIEVMLERDRSREQIHQLVEALDTEKTAHLETRNSLTMALGDTVDLLTKAQNQSQSGTSIFTISQLPESQILPQLPAIEDS
jgi:cell division septum initiation protein DivIVA